MSNVFIELLVGSVGFLIAVMVTTALSGKLVKMEGKHAGKLPGSKEFQGFSRIFPAFLVEAILLSVLFGYFEKAAENLLIANLQWIPSFIVEAFVLYYVWFCLSFDYKITRYWKVLFVLQLVVGLNVLIVYLLGMLGFSLSLYAF
jgi:hypothetical protein